VCAYSWKRWLASDGSHDGSDGVGGAPGAEAPSSGEWLDASEADVRRRGRLRIGARYELINEIGRGGMGVVWRALDRLSGRIVTLKQLRVRRRAEGRSTAGSRATLAGEFQLLASLRHPNIITVLDYGFDEEREPYLVMDLEENARTIIEAGADRSLGVRVELLVQTLRALVYLHRTGIVHRDVKPENILVVGDQVKLLDFGLSVSRQELRSGSIGFAGTPAYMAPELLDGAPPSAHSDLYALGMVALELFSGAYPFDPDDPVALMDHIRRTDLPRPQDAVPPALRPVLAKMLAKAPAERFREAGEVILALGSATGRPLSIETVTTRESFIEAAPFVGRAAELATLRTALKEAVSSRGGTWLLAGESGVGKSRLLDELRTQALIDGIATLRGQATSRGGRPYHVWGDVVRYLLLRVEVDDTSAEVLKTIVPDIGTLIGRSVRDPPAVDPDAAQARLLFAVEELLRLQLAPVVLILEDLQWAGSESLRLFAWLAQPASHLPLLVIGSYRTEEGQGIASAAPGARRLELARLSLDEVAALGAAMIGPAARSDAVRELLERETEGIPFFVVEVVRVLAENAGSLDRIAEGKLPERVLSGGIERVIRRRLERLEPEALDPLKTAAVIGREVDLELLVELHPGLDTDSWTAACSRVAILELRDQRWRFAHDKLREILDALMSANVRRERSRCVAEAIERIHGDRHATALAAHWRAAEEPGRELVYARKAGEQSLQTGAFPEAVHYFRRARELMQASDRGELRPPRGRRASGFLDPNAGVDPDGEAFARGLVESGLCEAYYRLGDLHRCRDHGERALEWFGQRVPRSPVAWLLAALVEAMTRSCQKLVGKRTRDPERALRVASEVARTQLRLVDVFFYSLQVAPLIWSSLRVVNQCEPAGRAPELAQGYAILGILAGAARLDRLGRGWSARGIAIAEANGHEREVAWTLTRRAVLDVSDAHFEDAEALAERSRTISERVGDLRLWEETRTLQAMSSLFAGELEQGLERYREVGRLSRRSGNRQIECWSRMGQGLLLSRLGRDTDALRMYEEARPMVDEDAMAMKSEAVCLFGLLALSRLRTGDPPGAYEAADRALWHIRAMRPIAYWLQPPLAAVVEVFLALQEEGWGPDGEIRRALPRRGRQALAGLRAFATHVPVGRPSALLWRGLVAWLERRPTRARRYWKRSIELAEQMGTPYERARAHLEIGRHMSLHEEGRSYHLSQALEQFGQLGSITDSGRAQAELDRSADAIRGGG